MSIPAYINSKITFIPAKSNIIETVQPVKISLKYSYQLDGCVKGICSKGHPNKTLKGQSYQVYTILL